MKIGWGILLWLWLLTGLVQADCGWIVIYDNNGVIAHGIPSVLRDQLQQQVGEQPVHSVCLTPNGGFTLCFGDNHYAVYLPDELRKELMAQLQPLLAQGCRLRQIAVRPNLAGYALLVDDKDFAYLNVPDEMHQYLQTRPEPSVGAIVFGPGDTYVISQTGGGYHGSAPPWVFETLEKPRAQGAMSNTMWLGENQFGAVYARNAGSWVNPPADLIAALNRVNQEGRIIRCVAVVENSIDVGVDFSKDDRPVQAAAEPPPSSPPPPPVVEASARPATVGGTFPLNGASFTFPPGSLRQTPSPRLVTAPQKLANPNRSLVSAAYSVEATGAPLHVRLPFDASRVKPGAKVYAVLGQGSATTRIAGSRVQGNAVEFDLPHYLGFHHASPDDTSPEYFAVASDLQQVQLLASAYGFQIWAVDGPKVRSLAPSILAEMRSIRAGFARYGFSLPEQVDLYLVPLRDGIRGHAANSSLEVNLDLWGDEGMRGTLAHELFHLVQDHQGTAYVPDTSLLFESQWCNEASAQFMAWKLYPNSPVLQDWVRNMAPDFIFQDLFGFVPTNVAQADRIRAHQYEAYIFLAFLDKYYDAAGLLGRVYAGDQRTDAACFHDLLDRLLLATPDKSGRRRGLSDVYMDYLVSYLWSKDFEPFASHHNPALGKAGQIMAGNLGAYHQAWNLPYQENGARQYEKTFRNQSRRFSVIRAYNISSMTVTTPVAETGSLFVSPKGGARGLRLLVFPYSSKRLSPLIGGPNQAVEIPDWEKLGGALVLAVQAGESEHQNFELSVSMMKPETQVQTAQSEDGPQVFELVGAELVGSHNVANFDPNTQTSLSSLGATASWTPPPRSLRLGQDFVLRSSVQAGGVTSMGIRPDASVHWKSTELIFPSDYLPNSAASEVRVRIRPQLAGPIFSHWPVHIYAHIWVGGDSVHIHWTYRRRTLK